MNWRRHWFSLRTRLMLWQLAVMLPLLLAAFFHFFYQMPRFIDPLTKIAGEVAEEVLQVKNLQLTLHMASMPLNDYFIHGLRRESEAFNSRRKQVDKGFAAIHTAPYTESNERVLIEEAWQEWNSAKGVAEEIQKISDFAVNADASEILERFNHHIDIASVKLEELYKVAYQEILEAQDKAREAHTQSQEVTIIAFIAAFLFSIVIGSTLVQGILNNLDSLCVGARQIAAGELGQQVKHAHGKGIHELQELTDAFNVMALKLQAHDDALQDLAAQDALTGLGNRRAMETSLIEEVERARRYGHPFCLLLLDIDHFKAVNDSYGHLAGDAVLRRLANICRGVVRPMDRVFRYGGEEFVVVVPETFIEGAHSLALRLREAVATASFTIAPETSIRLTISVGVAAFPQDADSKEPLIAAADSALYQAKQNGRNCVYTYDRST